MILKGYNGYIAFDRMSDSLIIERDTKKMFYYDSDTEKRSVYVVRIIVLKNNGKTIPMKLYASPWNFEKIEKVATKELDEIYTKIKSSDSDKDIIDMGATLYTDE